MDEKEIVLESEQLCCRCGDKAEGNYGAYFNGKYYPSCGLCALILGASISSGLRNANRGTRA